MRRLIFFLQFSVFLRTLLPAQVANISGTINSYAAVSGISCQTLSVSTTNGFSVGDRVLLIQMKGAVIDTTNTPAFGTILNYKGAGNYEMGTVQGIGVNQIILADSVVRKYEMSGAVQLVKVPVYSSANVNGLLTCSAWNGVVGGVLAFEVLTDLTLNANIDASGKGFRGALLSNGSLVSCQGDTSNYFHPSGTQSTAHKGEGIVNYVAARADGKGANANGGGGGHDCNGGGAGGGNYGLGGHGGDSKCNVSCPPYFYQNSGGNSGKKLLYSNVTNRVFMGGGGGAGHQNNGGGSPGTNGGGIILIIADSIQGNNYFISSDGVNNSLVANIDGQGGGGAGGSVLFKVRAYDAVNVSVQGGYGGVDNFTGTDCHGKGGGGGGGIIWSSALITSGITKFLMGGNPGIFTASGSLCYNTGNGATAGQNGGHIFDLIIPEGAGACLTSIPLVEDFKLRVFPNPALHQLTLIAEPGLAGEEFTIRDAMGRTVLIDLFKGERTFVDVFALSQGMYFVHTQKSCLAKFVKE